MEMERMKSVYVPGQVCRYRPEQVANQANWGIIPEEEATFASMHLIHVVPANGSTETRVNPLDPGDGFHREIPADLGRVVPAGRMR